MHIDLLVLASLDSFLFFGILLFLHFASFGRLILQVHDTALPGRRDDALPFGTRTDFLQNCLFQVLEIPFAPGVSIIQISSCKGDPVARPHPPDRDEWCKVVVATSED